jgi:hypothetical protein
MKRIVLVAAAFASNELASLAMARLRRYQANRAGKLQMARLGAVGRVADDVVVAGPVWQDDLETVRETVEDLGGHVASVLHERR